ncbi:MULTISPECIES: hypothetical protein [Actinomycetes]|uniref:hypothetical protein n=1 Tax=Actinomycetes TaxID=1760 RepID=UPI000B30B2C9|nr:MULTISPECIES: hypothetical protein [Actinomycetes]
MSAWPNNPRGDGPSLLTHDFGSGQVHEHINSLHHDLTRGHTEHFTDTDWWIVQWIST